jgi:hypothetical protein
MLNKYILGKRTPDSEIEVFVSEKLADYLCEEWVKVWGESFEYAKENYQYAFDAWQNNFERVR